MLGVHLMNIFLLNVLSSNYLTLWFGLCFCISYCGSTDAVDYMISAPAHGAVIGAWLGAWPMPLDWERPWQVKIPL